MQTASDLALSRCMADVGFADSIVFGPTAIGDGSSLNYGVWSRDEVRQYGYAVHFEDVIEWSDPTGSMNLSSPQAEAAMSACVDQVDAMGLALRPGPPGDDDARPEGPTESSQTAEGRAVIAEWTACLVARTSRHPTRRLCSNPRGVEQRPGGQVRIGLINIDCKGATFGRASPISTRVVRRPSSTPMRLVASIGDPDGQSLPRPLPGGGGIVLGLMCRKVGRRPTSGRARAGGCARRRRLARPPSVSSSSGRQRGRCALARPARRCARPG